MTYHLRHNAKWQDGEPLTARDVAFTFAAIMNPRNNVVSRCGYDEIARVETVETWTIRLRLRRRFAPILSTFLAPNQNYGILAAHLLAAKGDLNSVPFNDTQSDRGRIESPLGAMAKKISLEANAQYYAGKPAIVATYDRAQRSRLAAAAQNRVLADLPVCPCGSRMPSTLFRFN